MPIFEYQCEECETTFECIILSSRQREEAECPVCGSKEVERLFSTFSAGSSCAAPASSGFS